MGRDGLREIGKIGNPGFSEETSCSFCTLRILRVWILKVYISYCLRLDVLKLEPFLALLNGSAAVAVWWSQAPCLSCFLPNQHGKSTIFPHFPKILPDFSISSRQNLGRCHLAHLGPSSLSQRTESRRVSACVRNATFEACRVLAGWPLPATTN